MVGVALRYNQGRSGVGTRNQTVPRPGFRPAGFGLAKQTVGGPKDRSAAAVAHAIRQRPNRQAGRQANKTAAQSCVSLAQRTKLGVNVWRVLG